MDLKTLDINIYATDVWMMIKMLQTCGWC